MHRGVTAVGYVLQHNRRFVPGRPVHELALEGDRVFVSPRDIGCGVGRCGIYIDEPQIVSLELLQIPIIVRLGMAARERQRQPKGDGPQSSCPHLPARHPTAPSTQSDSDRGEKKATGRSRWRWI